MKSKGYFAGFLLLSLATSLIADASDAKQFWPQWRGPAADGVAPLADPPLNWSETKNVKWKAAIPGFGTSTPIIWGDQVFILTAIPTGKKAPKKPAAKTEAADNRPKAMAGMLAEVTDEIYQFAVISLDRKTGKVLWQKNAREEAPHE